MLTLPEHWRVVDILSDVHLRADAPRTFEAWRRHMLETPADAVFVLGDLFEVWIGDDACAGEFESACLRVLQESARTRSLAFLAGNRDFLVGTALLQSVPMQAMSDPTAVAGFGSRLLLAHGDAWCLEDRDYQRFRLEVRGEAWQSHFLGQPLAERRRVGATMRAASQARKLSMPDPTLWADLDRDAVVAALHAAGTRTLVHGHTHRPGQHDLGEGCTRWVLSDWDFDGPGPRGDVLRWSAEGLRRVTVASP
jgi:UDP-2,3-diacylglucosamine hydrolase